MPQDRPKTHPSFEQLPCYYPFSLSLVAKRPHWSPKGATRDPQETPRSPKRAPPRGRPESAKRAPREIKECPGHEWEGPSQEVLWGSGIKYLYHCKHCPLAKLFDEAKEKP